MGVNVDCATSGHEAVSMVESKHRDNKDYHIILVDWKMPIMDGISTAREIRNVLGNTVPVIKIITYKNMFILQSPSRLSSKNRLVSLGY